MTVRVSWLYPDPGTAGGQSRADTRLSPIGTMWPTGTMTTRSGLLAGGSPMALSGSGMTATIGLGQAVVQGTSAQGAYAAVVTAPHAVVLAAGHASLARIDVIALRIYDHPYDASNQYAGDIVVVAGTPASSPAMPAMPSTTTLPLYRITVPAGASAGTGGLTWGGATDMRVYTTNHGGILPVDATNAAGSYIGQYRESGSGLERWSGSAWAVYPPPAVPTPAVRMTKSGAAFGLGGAAYVVVQWSSADGTSGMWSAGTPGRIYPQRAGLWRITGWMTWPTGATNARQAIGVNSDTAQTYQLSFETTSNGGQGSAGSVVHRLAVGDYVTIQLYSTSAVPSIGAVAVGAALEWVAA